MEIRRTDLQTVVSTNAYVLAERTLDDGEAVLVTAQFQQGGRGQGGNSWESQAGKNLLFSLLTHPDWLAVRSQFVLSRAMALAVSGALSAYVQGVRIKWPNDIYVNDRKICGILIENRLLGGRIKDCVLGVGVNINQRVFLSDAPNPVSLCQLTGREEDPEKVLQSILKAFEKHYESLQSGGYAAVSAAYHAMLYRGKGFWPYRDKGGRFEAAVVEVEDDGHIVLRDKAGIFRRYAFKEVEFQINNKQ